MIGHSIYELDTPAMLLDMDLVEANIRRTARLTSDLGVRLRPHTKTHKLPSIAHLQQRLGAKGITVAKLGEAEVMADAGIDDIFIANQLIGDRKLARLKALAGRIRVLLGVDHRVQAEALSRVFGPGDRPIEVMVEVDTGQNRTGVAPGRDALDLARVVADLPGLRFLGIYTHEGHDYGVPDRTALAKAARKAQDDMVETAHMIRDVLGACEVSMGSTPSLIHGEFRSGIDELRPGTSVFYDASMANLIGHTDWCAATVLATVVNKPTPQRMVIDAGAKALTSDRRAEGTILHTPGFGRLVGEEGVYLASLSDEHGVVEHPCAAAYEIGEKVRVIPNHICPCINLYDTVYAIRGGVVEACWTVAARGKIQ